MTNLIHYFYRNSGASNTCHKHKNAAGVTVTVVLCAVRINNITPNLLELLVACHPYPPACRLGCACSAIMHMIGQMLCQ